MIEKMQDKKECWVCGRTDWIENHHVFGASNRKNSERYGLTVYLCYEHHRGSKGVHGGNQELADMLHKAGQKHFEKNYNTRKWFMKIFGKNYL